MAKSRTLPTLILLIFILPSPALGQAVPAEQRQAARAPGTAGAPVIVSADEAIALGRARMRDVIESDCPAITLDDEVVVCGRRPDHQRYRVPMSGPDVSRGTRERAGDAQLYAMEAGSTRCSAVGRAQTCGGGLDIIGIGMTIVRGVAQALANRD